MNFNTWIEGRSVISHLQSRKNILLCAQKRYMEKYKVTLNPNSAKNYPIYSTPSTAHLVGTYCALK
jgi:hypothetical protein